MSKAADLAIEKAKRLEAEGERDHFRRAVDELRNAEGWRENLWEAKNETRRLETELKQLKKDMQCERP